MRDEHDKSAVDESACGPREESDPSTGSGSSRAKSRDESSSAAARASGGGAPRAVINARIEAPVPAGRRGSCSGRGRFGRSRAGRAHPRRRPQLPEPPAPGDCDCSADGALPLLAAAMVDGEYVALASTSAGPAPVLADGGRRARRVARGGALVRGAGGVRGELARCRARPPRAQRRVPFVWRSYQVDDQVEPISVFGVAPAAFFLSPGFVEPIALPDTSARVFATVGDVAETSSGTLVVMIEHSGGEPESRYAAAVDVLRRGARGMVDPRVCAGPWRERTESPRRRRRCGRRRVEHVARGAGGRRRSVCAAGCQEPALTGHPGGRPGQ